SPAHFSEVISIRPLGVRLQDLRPHRGRPYGRSWTPTPHRRLPILRRRKQFKDNHKNSPLTGLAPSGMTQEGAIRMRNPATPVLHIWARSRVPLPALRLPLRDALS